jgi:N-6 DNA Methylase/TaqI-like C-terminal specificity domain
VTHLAAAAGRIQVEAPLTSWQRVRDAWRSIEQPTNNGSARFGGLFDAAWPDGPPDSAFRHANTPARLMARADSSAHRTLTRTYEHLLRYRPELQPDTGRITLRPTRARRKSSGSFYTPSAIAGNVVAAALLARSASSTPTVLDLSMGTGAFLLEAARALAGDGDEALVAETCLFGFDCDPVAVDLAILGIWLETGARISILVDHLRIGDPLASMETACRYDVVVGNPPWGIASSAYGRSAGTGRTDSFKLFLALALKLTRGSIGMIVPQAVLLQQSHADIRAALRRVLDPYFVATLPDSVFPDAAAPACALVFGPKPGPSQVTVLSGIASRIHSISAGRWTSRGFPLAPGWLLDLLEDLQRRHPVLGDLKHLYRVRDVGINYNRGDIARRVLYAGPEPEDPRDLPRYRGRNFDRYTPIAREGWIRHDAAQRLLPGERLAIPRSEFRAREKIVLRQTADRLVGTLDRTRMAMGRSVIAITAEGGESLPALLACLNSRLLTVLYHALAGEEGRILPQVKVARILDLPIALRKDRSTTWNRLHTLAGSMLACGGRDTELDRAIDRLIYEAYGLTHEQIPLIEVAP